jgi:hypothetical protein
MTQQRLLMERKISQVHDNNDDEDDDDDDDDAFVVWKYPIESLCNGNTSWEVDKVSRLGIIVDDGDDDDESIDRHR